LFAKGRRWKSGFQKSSGKIKRGKPDDEEGMFRFN
jgi:hypothetical protein